MNKKILGNFLLFLTSLIWGSTFVAQVTGMDIIGPFTFTATRSFIAVIFLGIMILFIKDSMQTKIKDMLKGGIACGFFIFMGSSLQQIGLLYTTAGKTSFITSLYILIVPLVGLIVFKTRVNLITWIAIFLGAIGLYLLAVSNINELAINRGDLIVLLGSFFWGTHIIVIDYFTKKVNAIKLSFMQFLVLTIFSTICVFIFESDTATSTNIMLSWKPIAYAGFFSSCIAYTLQMVGQKYTDPILASLILSLESVFGAVSGYLFLNEILTKREFIGCIIMFIAIVMAQIPDNFFKKNKN